MSTKTTLKRVAAVAAAALTLGGLSAVSAHAATNTYLYVYTADGITAGAGTKDAGNGVAGPANTVTVALLGSATKDEYVTISGGTIASANNAAITVATSGLSASRAANATTTAYTMSIPTPSVGTITLSLYQGTGGIYGATAAETVTITVGTAAASGSYSAAKTTIYAAAGDTTTVNATSQASVDATPIVKSKNASDTAAASFAVSYLDALGAGIADTITATVSGAGEIDGVAANSSVRASTGARTANQYSDSVVTTSSNYVATFYLYANGQSGLSTVTFRNSAGTVIGTKTVTFSDTTVATLAATTRLNYIASSGSATGTAGTKTGSVFSVTAKDASGFAVSGATVTAAAADTTLVTSVTCTESTTGGTFYCSATGASAKSGKTTVTFTTTNTATGAKLTTTADVTVSSVKAATLSIVADSSVASGSVITYTVTAKDANGLPVPDGTAVTNYVGSPLVSGGAQRDYSSTANADSGASNTVDALFTNVVFVGGVATDSVQAPYGSTTIVASFTNTGTATVIDANFSVASLPAAATSVSTSVTGDPAVQAATDAAQEATDAANAAYDAANNAMDSADAATAAAQDAADNASAALAAVTSLSATVAKLVKSVAAVAAALAKIQKKIGA